MKNNIFLSDIRFNELCRNNIFHKYNNNLKIIIPLNAQLITIANENKKFKYILNNNYTSIDGQIPYFILKNRYKSINIEKISGSDLIYDFCEFAKKNDKKIFLLGGLEISNKMAIQILKEKYKINISGFSPKYKPYPFDYDHNKDIINKIQEFKPHILFVAFGAPKQEFWIWDNKEILEQIGIEYAVACGGTLEFVANIKKRAPKIIQNIGLEGLYRLFQEPSYKRFERLLTSIKMFKYI
jgi:N-acetylglucosaminyldiphosphoundecaprenol N-acetyl-beta-D-mannosaminyltransferase